jgi:very-short-patch-repair endonuclease
MKRTLGIRTQAPSREGWDISPARRDRLKERAREMRRNPTEPEQALWERLSEKRLGGFAFKRKVVVGSAIADFACADCWLTVEVDGDANDTPAVDEMRDARLTEAGIRVLRFTADEVADDIDAVEAAILAELNKPFTRPGSGSAPARQPERR